MELTALPSWYLPALFAALGAVFGSFSAVVVDRTVREEDVNGRSGCVTCGAPIPWYLNIPLIAWPLLRGRARCCGEPIPAYLWLVEIATAGGFLTAALLSDSVGEAATWAAYVLFAVVVGGIDAITRLVYLRWVQIFGGVAWMTGVLTVILAGQPQNILAGVVGAAAVIVALELISFLIRVVLGKPGVGRGDTYIVAVSAGVPALLMGDWLFGVVGFAAGWMLGGVGGAIKAAATPELRERMRGWWWLRAAAVGAALGALAGIAVGVSVGIGVYWPSITPLAAAGGVAGIGLGVIKRLFRGGFVGVKMPFGPFLVAGPFLLWVTTRIFGGG